MVAQDISERRKIQEELVKAQKLESLGILAGGIAHDFNNILTGILGSLSISLRLLDPSHKVAGYLEQCERATIRASELTRQLLTFSRGGEPLKKPISLASVIRETASFTLRGSNVKSSVEPAKDLWCVEADEGQLNQVLNNLLLNAIQAMPDGGTLTVRAVNETLGANNQHRMPPGDYVKMTVEDQGQGIPAENLMKIFDPYFTTKAGGSGLGLTSVYSIVKKHGGTVEVSSSTGTGTCFTVLLPASPGKQLNVPCIDETADSVGSGRVLVMDDEKLIREIAMEILEFIGYAAESCKDGQEAVEAYRAAMEQDNPFTAAILDLTIPGGMSGEEAAARILEIDPKALLIVSSGYSNAPIVSNYRKYGFSAVIPKPFDVGTLAGTLENMTAPPS